MSHEGAGMAMMDVLKGVCVCGKSQWKQHSDKRVTEKRVTEMYLERRFRNI